MLLAARILALGMAIAALLLAVSSFQGSSWLRASAKISPSSSLIAANPAKLPPLADLYISRSRYHASREDYSQGISELEQVLALRSTWPYDWMRLVEYYGQARIFDERLTIAMRNTLEFGPSERVIWFRSASFMLRYWYALNDQQRGLLEPSLYHVLEQKRWAGRMFYQIENIERTRLFCRRFKSLVADGDGWCAAYQRREKARK